MLQVDPTLTKLTKARKRSLTSAMLTIALLAALLFFSGKKFFKPVFPFISAELWWFPALILFFFLAIQLSAAQEGFLRRVESRRQATVQGDKRFLAAEQPKENVNVLTLPITFRLHLNNLPIISAFFVTPFVLFALVMLYRWLIQSIDLVNASLWISSGIFLVILLFLSLILYWQFTTEFMQVIEVSDEGLRTRYKGQKSTIRWNEARLFAFYGVFGDARGHGTQTYELSGSDIVVKWTEYQRKNRMWYLKTGLTFEEYRSQLVALNNVIAARTRLPLNDLRSMHR